MSATNPPTQQDVLPELVRRALDKLGAHDTDIALLKQARENDCHDCQLRREACLAERLQFRGDVLPRIERLDKSMSASLELQAKHLEEHKVQAAGLDRSTKVFLGVLAAIITLVGPLLTLTLTQYLKN